MRLRDRLWIVALFLAVASVALAAGGSHTLFDNALAPSGVALKNVQPGLDAKSPFINVRAAPYLATPNDVTKAAANTLAFQAALDQGGTIMVPGGPGDVYYLNASTVYNGASTATALAIGDDTRLIIENDVTLRLAPGQNTSILVSKAFATAQTSVVVTWTSGATASVAWTGHPFAVGDYCAIQGAAQSAFVGVFLVSAVADSGHFTVVLYETPTGVASGTITAVKANVHIEIEGALWNYDALAQTSTPTGPRQSAINLGYIQRLSVRNVRVKDCGVYALAVGSVSDYEIKQIHLDGSAISSGPTVKIYGPAFNGEASFITGRTGDDAISVQAMESTAFLLRDFTGGGSVFGLKMKNVGADDINPGTTAVAIYLPISTSPWKTDNIEVDGMVGYSASANGRIKIAGDPNGTDATSQGGTIKLRHIRPIAANTGYAITVDQKAYVRNLVMEQLSFDDPGLIAGQNYINIKGRVDVLTLRDSVFRNFQFILQMGPTVTVDVLNIENIRAETISAVVGLYGSTINMINMRGNSIAGASVVGSLINGNSGTNTIKTINLVQNILDSNCHSFVRTSVDLGNPTINLIANQSAAPIGVQTNFNTRLNAVDNTFVSVTSGMLRVNDAGTQTFTITGSGNTFTAGTPFVKLNGAEKISISSPDMKVDLAAVQRTAGSMAIASVNAGTILANNLAVCDATAAANSWKQLSNTTLVF